MGGRARTSWHSRCADRRPSELFSANRSGSHFDTDTAIRRSAHLLHSRKRGPGQLDPARARPDGEWTIGFPPRRAGAPTGRWIRGEPGPCLGPRTGCAVLPKRPDRHAYRHGRKRGFPTIEGYRRDYISMAGPPIRTRDRTWLVGAALRFPPTI